MLVVWKALLLLTTLPQDNWKAARAYSGWPHLVRTSSSGSKLFSWLTARVACAMCATSLYAAALAVFWGGHVDGSGSGPSTCVSWRLQLCQQHQQQLMDSLHLPLLLPRSLMQRGCSEKKPIPAELISTAASAVRPLMPLALSMLQLLPMGLMRRCSLAVNIPAPIATKELPGAIATSAPLPSGVQAPHQHQLLPLQGGFELGVSAMGKQHQQPMAGWGGGVPAVASPVGGLAGLYGGMF